MAPGGTWKGCRSCIVAAHERRRRCEIRRCQLINSARWPCNTAATRALAHSSATLLHRTLPPGRPKCARRRVKFLLRGSDGSRVRRRVETWRGHPALDKTAAGCNPKRWPGRAIRPTIRKPFQLIRCVSRWAIRCLQDASAEANGRPGMRKRRASRSVARLILRVWLWAAS